VGFKMQYQIEFTEDANTIVHMMNVEAGSPATAFQLFVEKGWPPGAIAARVFDNYGLARTFHLRASGQVRIPEASLVFHRTSQADLRQSAKASHCSSSV